VNGGSLFVFNVTSIDATESVVKGEIHIYKRRSGEAPPPSAPQSSARRTGVKDERQQPPSVKKQLQADSSAIVIIVYELAPNYLREVSSFRLPEAASRPGWHTFDITTAVKDCFSEDQTVKPQKSAGSEEKMTETVSPKVIAVSFVEERNGRSGVTGRPSHGASRLLLSRFYHRLSRPFLMLFTKERRRTDAAPDENLQEYEERMEEEDLSESGRSGKSHHRNNPESSSGKDTWKWDFDDQVANQHHGAKKPKNKNSKNKNKTGTFNNRNKTWNKTRNNETASEIVRPPASSKKHLLTFNGSASNASARRLGTGDRLVKIQNVSKKLNKRNRRHIFDNEIDGVDDDSERFYFKNETLIALRFNVPEYSLFYKPESSTTSPLFHAKTRSTSRIPALNAQPKERRTETFGGHNRQRHRQRKVKGQKEPPSARGPLLRDQLMQEYNTTNGSHRQNHKNKNGGDDVNVKFGRGRGMKPGAAWAAARRERCGLRRLVIDFADIGWSERVISPKSFEANYCDGSCPFPISQVRNTQNSSITNIV